MVTKKIALKLGLALSGFVFFFLYGFSAILASPQNPKGNNPAPAWEPFLTYFSKRIRVERRLVDPANDIWEYKAYNYAPGQFGNSYPQEDPLYSTEPVERMEWVLNGRTYPITKDSNGLVIGTVDFSTIRPNVNNTAVLRIYGSKGKILEQNYGTFHYSF